MPDDVAPLPLAGLSYIIDIVIQRRSDVGKLVQARLDDETDGILKELRRRTGLSDSEIVRRGVRSLAALSRPAAEIRVVGLGQFSSGVRDLGSNKEHLKSFGRK